MDSMDSKLKPKSLSTGKRKRTAKLSPLRCSNCTKQISLARMADRRQANFARTRKASRKEDCFIRRIQLNRGRSSQMEPSVQNDRSRLSKNCTRPRSGRRVLPFRFPAFRVGVGSLLPSLLDPRVGKPDVTPEEQTVSCPLRLVRVSESTRVRV